MRILAAIALCTLLAMGGCASVNLNDPDLTKQADTADAAVQAADTLKPYAMQMANLQAFSAQQDIAVASRDIATRDGVVVPLLADKDGNLLAALDTDACTRLASITGGLPCKDDQQLLVLAYISTKLSTNLRLIDDDQQTVDATRAAYERIRTTTDAKDDCDSLKLAASPAPGASPVDQQLGFLKDDCKILADATDNLQTLRQQIRPVADSPLATAFDAARPATPQKAVPQSGVDVDLKAEVQKAADLAAKGDVKSLEKFQADIEAILKDSSAVVQIAGLTKLQDSVADLLMGTLCSPPPVTGGDCKSVVATSSAGRSAAVWSLLQAISQTLDANDPGYRSAAWLAAANAILAAEKTSAQIQANADAQAASSANARLVDLAAAASALAQVHQLASGRLPCNGGVPAYCGLAAYLSAWNTGLIPADVLTYREMLTFSQIVLQKQLAAQTDQQVLARSASGSLKAYADGGIQPATIAQLIFDAGLLGVAASK